MPAVRTGLTAAKDTSVTSPGDQDLADVAVFAHTLKRLRRPRDRKHRIHDDAARALLDLRRGIPSGGVDREIRPDRVEGLELVGAACRGGHARAGPLRYLDGREPHAGRTRVHQY